MQIMIYPPTMQGTGAFDGGRITEQKPIGFPGERSVVKRVGPLFYWAWAFAAEEGYIGSHPHQAFEIMTYVLAGKAEHGDSLGTRSVVGPGGAQVMQTGSGVSHEERFIGPDMEGFQIWFEPELNEALKRTPTYRQFDHEEFPEEAGEGYVRKTVIGDGSPVELVADAKVWDLTLEPGAVYPHVISAGHTLTALAVRGHGAWADASAGGAVTPFRHKDFMLLGAAADTNVSLQAADDETLRIMLIEVPTTVDYPLYPKR
ncbi:pirin family protein [Paenibacillus ehimensis]|uniref:Pirin family protein n=1 Tax=Paenibacillus ehimensis TaxID=79264 RepID=A0ABT8V3H4_9BACL|nr:pirin family protein [Paenibacillus ehimensis]MDO3675986.1 pirin family protein [Paenibacillus ehimensis]